MNFLKKNVAVVVAQTLAVLITFIGLICMAGYATHHKEFYTWANDVSMAYPTSICFFLTGICLFTIAGAVESK